MTDQHQTDSRVTIPRAQIHAEPIGMILLYKVTAGEREWDFGASEGKARGFADGWNALSRMMERGDEG